MFAPTRDEARRFLIGAWAKRRAGSAASALETLAGDIITLHPEYVQVLEHAEAHVEREYRPETGDVNPFLHLQLHLAVAEQLAIDQPPGIKAQFERLLRGRGDEHAALHALLECLGETIWVAQRHGKPPDAALYLACLERQR